MITRHQLRAGRLLADLQLQELAEMTGVAADVLAAFERGEVDSLCEQHADSLHSALCDRVEFAACGWLRHRDDDVVSRPDNGDVQRFLAQVQREQASTLPSDIQSIRRLRRKQQMALREADKRAVIVVSLYLRDGVQKPDSSIPQELADNLLLRATAAVMRRLHDDYGTLVSASALAAEMGSVRNLHRQLAAEPTGAAPASRATQPRESGATLPVVGAHIIDFPVSSGPDACDDGLGDDLDDHTDE